MDIVIYDGSAFETWNPETLAKNGAGGSEFMLADVSRLLAARGHRVRVFVKSDGLEGTFGGVEWCAIRRAVEVRECDVLVAWRTPEVIRSSYLVKPKATVFVATDSHYGDRLTPEKIAGVDRFVVMSDWHKNVFCGMHPVPADKVDIIRTGVDQELFRRLTKQQQGGFRPLNRLIHTSAPTRSLRRAIAAMPAIRAERSDAELHVYHGFLTLSMFAENRNDNGLRLEIQSLKQLIIDNHEHGVRYHDRVPREEMYRALLRSHVWVYPTHVAETSCMAAQEAIAAGCNVVAFNLGALPQTIGEAGVLLPHTCTDGQYVRAVLAALDVDRANIQGRLALEVPSLDQMVARYERLMLGLLKASTTAPVPEAPTPAAAPAERKGIALAMIMKNESQVIAETLRRAKPLVDGYHLIDTGSTDDTESIAKKELEGLPGMIERRPWVSFGHNRTELLANAKAAGWKWLLLLDADRLVNCMLNAEALGRLLDRLGADQYLVQGTIADTEFDMLFAVRADMPWFYDLPTHEWLFCTGPMKTGRLTGGITIHETGTSHRRMSGKKFEEDIRMLTDYLADPAAPHRPRATFYLAQSYRDAGNTKLALKHYLDRASIGGLDEERFIAALEAARAATVLNLPSAEIRALYAMTIGLRGTRMEGHYGLGHHLRVVGEYRLAVEHLARAVALPPTTDQLFINKDVYDWKAKDELGVALSWISDPGARDESVAISRELLESGKLPESERKRVEERAQWCAEQIARDRAARGVSGSEPPSAPGEWLVVSPSSELLPAARALDDVAEMLLHGLREAGSVANRARACQRGKTNLVVGAHVLGWSGWGLLVTDPETRVIVYQTEVWSSPWWQNSEFHERLHCADEVWDYSEVNAEKLRERMGGDKMRARVVPVRVVPLGYSHATLVPESEPTADHDVLFFGSVNDRRRQVFDRITAAGLKLMIAEGNQYFGARRDRLVRSAKVILNLHYYDGAPYEQARLVPLLASGIPVVSEVSGGDDWIGSAILHKTALENLCAECLVLVKSDKLRVNAAEHARTTMLRHPMREHLIRAIGEMSPRAPAAATRDVPAEQRPVPTLPQGIAPVWPTLSQAYPQIKPLRLNLGCSDQKIEGYVNVDRVAPADQIVDLTGPWPWGDSTVDEIRAHDIIEHLADKNHTMNEAWRVLKPGGRFDIRVPTTDGRGAFQDPTHVSYWNRNSFWYYEDGDAHRERFGDAYGIKARFRTKLSVNGKPDANLIAHLDITLEAVKPSIEEEVFGAAQRATAGAIAEAEADMLAGASTIGLHEGRVEVVSTPSKFVGMLRVKNEARWIDRCLDSLLPLCDEIFVLDDRSTDDTAVRVDLLDEHQPRRIIRLIETPFGSFDEARDKQFLLDAIRSHKFPPGTWVINIDGDEKLAPGAADAIRAAARGDAMALSLPVYYLWDSPAHRRVDGVYGTFTRVSAFPLHTLAKFRGSAWAAGGLHCGNAPEDLKASAVRVEAPILHYGYMERVDRVRKYRFYNRVDPNNQNEDCYRHMIAGDGPPREGEEDIVFPSAEERTRHAGPLRLEGLRGDEATPRPT